MANLAFLHVEDGDPLLQRKLAEIMVASVKKFPCWVIQMTDFDTPPIKGVDEVRRLGHCPFMLYRLKHIARLNKEALILDTDVVVLKDPFKVFNLKFDVALTKRDKRIVSKGMGYTEDDPLMPYNTGVMFSRNTQFWDEAVRACESLEDRHQKWYGDQISVAQVVDSREFDIAELNCERWNYTPASEDEDLTGRSIVHYKGKRKHWMINAYQ